MKVILIDPDLKSFKEIEVETCSFKECYKLMDCSIIEIARPFPNGVFDKNVLYLDEEGRLKNPKTAFYLNSSLENPIFVGKAILLAENDKGKAFEPIMSLTLMGKLIRFIDLK